MAQELSALRFRMRVCLTRAPMAGKLCFLAAVAFTLFFSNMLIPMALFKWYVLVLAVFVFFLAVGNLIIVGASEFRMTLFLGIMGTLVYMPFAIVNIYIGSSLAPGVSFDALSDRWFYILAYPLRVLGTLFAGLIFIRIVSPAQFVKWGRYGLLVALLLRTIEYAMDRIEETKMALAMQGKWPQEGTGLGRLREAWLKIRLGPTLIMVVVRNVFLWSPWAVLCYLAIERETKGGRK